MDTVRIHDDNGTENICPSDSHLIQGSEKLQTTTDGCSAITSPLPSPLLCPRRTFLASLILASKFTQDKCYSNRAWAKLSGLPPREIGRCERALGQALEWRLWVGKLPVPPQSPSPPAKRPVVRCQSEGSLRPLATSQTPFLVQNEKSATLAPYPSPPRSSGRAGLKRCATLPAEAFVAQIPEYSPCDPLLGAPVICSAIQDDIESPDQLINLPSDMVIPTLKAMLLLLMYNP